jgi:ATP-binding cassette subfamily C protein CydD/ATP-binding cassette subfamily C protein CydCD
VKPLDPRLLRYARATRAYLVVTVLLGLASAALIVAQASLLASGITEVFPQDRGLRPSIVAWLGAVLVARAGTVWAQ